MFSLYVFPLLKESTAITMNSELQKAAGLFFESAKLFTEIGLLFKGSETAKDLKERIEIASRKLERIADIEEDAFRHLSENI